MHLFRRGLQQQSKHRRACFGIIQIQHYGDELVPAQPGHCIAFAQGALHVEGQRGEQPIPGFPSVPVVYFLEAVQIEIRNCKHLFSPVRLGHGLVQAIRKENPVGQTRQFIVVSKMFQLLRVLFELGYVGKQRHILQ